MATLAYSGVLGAKALDGGEMLRDDAKPRNGDCWVFVEVWLAVACGESRRVELRTEPSSWRGQLRTSAMAGKAPNARVQRGRERHSKNA